MTDPVFDVIWGFLEKAGAGGVARVPPSIVCGVCLKLEVLPYYLCSAIWFSFCEMRADISAEQGGQSSVGSVGCQAGDLGSGVCEGSS